MRVLSPNPKSQILTPILFAGLNLVDEIFRLLEERRKFFALNFFIRRQIFDASNLFVTVGDERFNIFFHVLIEALFSVHEVARSFVGEIFETGDDIVARLLRFILRLFRFFALVVEHEQGSNRRDSREDSAENF